MAVDLVVRGGSCSCELGSAEVVEKGEHTEKAKCEEGARSSRQREAAASHALNQRKKGH